MRFMLDTTSPMTPGMQLMKPRARIWSLECPCSLGLASRVREEALKRFDIGAHRPLCAPAVGACRIDVDYQAQLLRDWVLLRMEEYASETFVRPDDAALLRTGEHLVVLPAGAGISLHADDETFTDDGDRILHCHRVMTCLLFLEGGCGGGELEFPKQSVSTKPRVLHAFFFPSNRQFKYQIRPVIQGIGLYMVTHYSMSHVQPCNCKEEQQ